MPVTFRAVSLRRADEETTPGVHCLDEIAVKDKPLPEVARTAERQCLRAEKEAQPVVLQVLFPAQQFLGSLGLDGRQAY